MFKRCQTLIGLMAMSIVITTGLLGGCERPAPGPQTESEPTDEGAGVEIPLVIGTYTGDTGSVVGSNVEPSRGLYLVNYDSADGQLSQPVLAASIDNPSFGAIDPDKGRIYVASETEVGEVAAFQWRPGSTDLNLINSVPSAGAYPCYVSLSPDMTRLAVANYVSGNIAVYELDPDTGAIGDSPQTRKHAGRGPNLERQEGPHAHWVEWAPEGRFLYVVDLGIDEIVGYSFDASSGRLGEGFTALKTEAGAGPRHLVFHPKKNLVYIFNELSNSVVVASRENDGRLTVRQTLSSLPADFSGHSQGAHIAINADGTHLYASNRGHDSIVVFDVAEDGQLGSPEWISTQGDWPRFFTILPDQQTLLVANERSHNLVTFDIHADGHLSPTGQSVQLAQPVYAGSLAAP